MKKLFSIIVIAVLLTIQLTTPVFACDPTPPDPRTQGYWKNHVSEWCGGDLKKIAISNPYDPDEIFTWQQVKDILSTPPKGDAWYILAHQWIAYKLNFLYRDCDYYDVVWDAWKLVKLGPGNIPKDSRAYAIELANKLDAMNNGNFDE